MPDAKLAPNLPDWMVEHANRYISSGGADGHMYKMTQPGRSQLTVPSLLLTTTGRKSGQLRTCPVVYLEDDGRFVIINTNAGNAPTPAWSFNLKANPEAEVEIGSRKQPVRASVAEGEERADLWRKHNLQYSGFDEYAEKLDREIAVFVLDPAPVG